MGVLYILVIIDYLLAIIVSSYMKTLQMFCINNHFVYESISECCSCYSYSGFGQPQAFSFPPQSRGSGTPNSSGDMQGQANQMSIDLSSSEFPSLSNRSVPQTSLPSIRNYG